MKSVGYARSAVFAFYIILSNLAIAGQQFRDIDAALHEIEDVQLAALV